MRTGLSRLCLPWASLVRPDYLPVNARRLVAFVRTNAVLPTVAQQRGTTAKIYSGEQLIEGWGVCEPHAARASSLASLESLAAGRSSPSHADICARRCGSSQCGQLNLVISRGRSAKLAGSRSNPVSTW